MFIRLKALHIRRHNCYRFHTVGAHMASVSMLVRVRPVKVTCVTCVYMLHLPLVAFDNPNYKIVGMNVKKKNHSTIFDGVMTAGMTTQVIQASILELCNLQLCILT
jgi:hypothetical protein